MKKTTQKLRTSQPTITEPPTVLSLNVKEEDHFREEWEGTKLPNGINGTMAMIEEAVSGLDGVCEILQRDATHRSTLNSHATGQIEYTPLDGNITFRLWSAQRVLVNRIDCLLDAVKELSNRGRSEATT